MKMRNHITFPYGFGSLLVKVSLADKNENGLIGIHLDGIYPVPLLIIIQVIFIPSRDMLKLMAVLCISENSSNQKNGCPGD